MNNYIQTNLYFRSTFTGHICTQHIKVIELCAPVHAYVCMEAYISVCVRSVRKLCICVCNVCKGAGCVRVSFYLCKHERTTMRAPALLRLNAAGIVYV